MSDYKMRAYSASYGGVDLGDILGDIAFSYGPEWGELHADKYKKTPLGFVGQGEVLTVKIPVGEYTQAILKQAFPNSVQMANGVGVGSNRAVVLNETNAKELFLSPCDNAVGDLTGCITYHKAVIVANFELTLHFEKQTVIQFEFRVIPDTTKPMDRNLFYFDYYVGA